MTLIRFLPLLLCFSSLAQVNLVIKDETDAGFFLNVNYYRQNKEAAKELAIKKLDTFPVQLQFKFSESVFFHRKLHLHKAGTYSYVITTNSKDELQLRYRGKLSSIPSSAKTMDYQTELIEKGLYVTKVSKSQEEPLKHRSVDPIDSASAIVVSQSESPVEPKTPVAAKPILVSKPPIESVETQENPKLTSLDTAKPKEISQVSQVKASVDPFEVFFKELEATEFEFEKLGLAKAYAEETDLTTSNISAIFKVMKYDNTRLELIRALGEKRKKLKDLPSLKDHFEYEISKQQFNDLIQY